MKYPEARVVGEKEITMVKDSPFDPLSFLHSKSRGDGKITTGIIDF